MTEEVVAPVVTEQASEAPVEAPAAPVEGQPTPEAVPAYQPNFKYKVRDKELEIDEEVRPLIKDKDSEAKWKRFFEKANGLDHIIQDKEALSKQYSEYKQQYEPIVGTVREAFEHYKRGDLDLAFEKLGIPEQKLFEHVYKKLQMQEMPADQRSALEKATKYERENYALKSQFEQQQEFMQQQMIQQRVQQLDMSLSQPEYSQIAQAYDQAKGQPGAFKNFVIMVAGQHSNQTGQDLPAHEAVAMVAKMFPSIAPSPAQSHVQTQIIAPSGVPVIPVARGGGVSAVRKRPSSVEDIEKEYEAYQKS